MKPKLFPKVWHKIRMLIIIFEALAVIKARRDLYLLKMKSEEWQLSFLCPEHIFLSLVSTHTTFKYFFQVPPSGEGTGHNLAVLHVGAPACGMNAAVRSFVRNCIAGGNTALAVHNGIEGLVEGDIQEMK